MQAPEYEIVKQGPYYQVMVNGQPHKGPTANKERAENRLDALHRQAKVQVRKCMTCRQPFVSEGIHNRMCGKCRIHADEAVAV